MCCCSSSPLLPPVNVRHPAVAISVPMFCPRCPLPATPEACLLGAKGDKASLEFLLDVALEQQMQGKRLNGKEGPESYLQGLQRAAAPAGVWRWSKGKQKENVKNVMMEQGEAKGEGEQCDDV